MSWRSPGVARRRSLRSPRNFGISESCLRNWLQAAAVEEGSKPGVTSKESAELREAKKRVRLLEQENEVLRRAAAYFAQAHLPGK